MLEIAVELATRDSSYDDMAAKFTDHFLWIAHAMNCMGSDGMWDEEDGFYYDVVRFPDGRATRLKVRSMVGLLPICATTVAEPYERTAVPRAVATYTRTPAAHAGTRQEHSSDWTGSSRGGGPRHLCPGGSGEAAPDPRSDAR